MSHPSDKLLEEAAAVVSEEMAAFETEYARQFVSENESLTPLLSLVGMPKGKRLRPLIFFLSRGLLGRIKSEGFKAAVILELLHAASLVHDDVVDDSAVRRGEETVNAIWGNKAAVLLGDYLFARVLALGIELNWPGSLQIISRTAVRMGGGELRQTLTGKGIDTTEADYFQTIRDKTAGLFSAACEIAGLSNGSPADRQKQLSDLGESFGFIFQIQDDILDLMGYEEIMGKPSWQDIQNSNVTLPMILALQNSAPEEKEAFQHHLQKGLKKDAEWIFNHIQDKNGFDKAREIAIEYKDKAIELLYRFPQSKFRAGMKTLIEYGIARKW